VPCVDRLTAMYVWRRFTHLGRHSWNGGRDGLAITTDATLTMEPYASRARPCCSKSKSKAKA
jgi:hypothetical protein